MCWPAPATRSVIGGLCCRKVVLLLRMYDIQLSCVALLMVLLAANAVL